MLDVDLGNRCSIHLSYGSKSNVEPTGVSRRIYYARLRMKSKHIRHELALQPGLAVFKKCLELKGGEVKLDGDNVVEFPKLPEPQPVTLKVLRWEERDKRMVIKEAQRLS